jgi:putative hemolysin
MSSPVASLPVPAAEPHPSFARAGAYPARSDQIPAWHVQRSPLRARFARTPRELEAIQRLRYRVFNLELGEGLASSRAIGRDDDGFDERCHHLLVTDEQTGIAVGTYRLATLELAGLGGDFYSAQEFDLSDLAPAVLAGAVELGRACIAAPYRGRRVLALLWEGIAAYAAHNRKRFLFGCASLPGALAPAAGALGRLLREADAIDPALPVRPRPGYEAPPADGAPATLGAEALPPLVRRYLQLGARLAAEPAFDRAFGTLDYFTMIDLEATRSRLAALLPKRR